jgi:tRNA(Ile)-lysidine synthase
VLVAVSGGLDSSVLLHVLAGLRDPLGLTLAVGHVNHGLRGEASEADERAVAAQAAALGLPFASERVAPGERQTGVSSRLRPTLQEAARSLRRAALARMRVRLGCDHVATAHHADDQAETVLMRLVRGCGPDSLGGIPDRSIDGVVIRPLLGIPRADLEAFAREHAIGFQEDASNADLRYTRNRLRATVLPTLARDFNPRLLRAIGNLAEAQRRDSEWIEQLVRNEAGRSFARGEDGSLRIDAQGWAERPEALSRRLLVLALVEMGGGRELSRVHLMRGLAFLRAGRLGASIELPGGIRLRREAVESFRLERASDRELEELD